MSNPRKQHKPKSAPRASRGRKTNAKVGQQPAVQGPERRPREILSQRSIPNPESRHTGASTSEKQPPTPIIMETFWPRRQRIKANISERQLKELLGTEPVEWLREQSVLSSFTRLVERGCDPQRLWNELENIMFAWIVENPQSEENRRRTFKGVMGFDRSKLGTVVKRIRQCARDVEQLPVPLLVQVFNEMLPHSAAVESQPAGSRGRNLGLRDLLSELRNLRRYYAEVPRHLRLLALAASEGARGLRFRGHPLYDQAVASLVRYVQEATEKPHNEEVSALIAAVTGRGRYDAVAHCDWRKRNRYALRKSPRK